eukprot:scpid67880/ scgid16026/ 
MRENPGFGAMANHNAPKPEQQCYYGMKCYITHIPLQYNRVPFQCTVNIQHAVCRLCMTGASKCIAPVHWQQSQWGLRNTCVEAEIMQSISTAKLECITARCVTAVGTRHGQGCQ